MSTKPLPFPGTPDAFEQGCRCNPLDFDGEDSANYLGWLTSECPIHDSPADPIRPADVPEVPAAIE